MLHLIGLTATLLAVASAPSAAPRSVNYRIEFLVMKTAPREGRFTAERVTPLGSAVALTGRFAAEWGDESLKSDGRALLVNGAPLAPGSARDAAAGVGTPAVLSRPVVVTPAGEAATLKAGSTENTQYFSREPDGRYALKTTPISPELQFDVTLDKESSTGEVQMQLGYRFVRLGRRAPVDGVSLDVGQPEIKETAGVFRIPLKLGEWCLVGLQDDLAAGLVLVLRATRQP